MVATLMAGCDGSAGAQLHTGQTIRIGLNLELSGGREHIGNAALQGAQLAVDQVNEAGGINGKQIELVQTDNVTSIGRAVAQTTKLMTQGKVLAVFGPVTADVFRATLTTADKQEIAVMSSLACNTGLLDRSAQTVHEFGFRSCVGYDFQGSSMAKFAVMNLSAATAMVLTATDGPAAEFSDAFARTLTNLGGSAVVQEGFSLGETDFGRLVERARQTPVDVVYIAGPPTEAAHIIRTLREAGINVPILGMESHDSPVLGEIAGPAALNKVYFTTNFSPLDTENPNAKRFAEAYRARYEGTDATQMHALAHDAMLMIIDAIKRANEMTGVAVQRALVSTSNLEGATGRLSIGPGHEVIKDALVIELADGVPAAVLHVAP